MARDGMPIEFFISQSMSKNQAHEITAGWRIDPDRLEAILARVLREMGIYIVYPDQMKVVFDTLIVHLKHSPEIQKMVRAAQIESANRGHSRHAD